MEPETDTEQGGGLPPKVRAEQQAKEEALADAFATIATNSDLSIDEVAGAYIRAKQAHDRDLHVMIDADKYVGPLFSCRNMDTGESAWAVQLPDMFKISGDDGTAYGKPGDLILLENQDGKPLPISQSIFADTFTWEPRSYLQYVNNQAHLPGDDKPFPWQVMRQTGPEILAKARKYEANPNLRRMNKLEKIYWIAWGLSDIIVTLTPGGQVSVSSPQAPASALTYVDTNPNAPSWAMTITRFKQDYIMLTTIGGAQRPELQGKTINILPKIINLMKENEGLEIFGEFAYNLDGIDNFVDAYLRNGREVYLVKDLKDEWKFAYLVLQEYKRQTHGQLTDLWMTEKDAKILHAALGSMLNAEEHSRTIISSGRAIEITLHEVAKVKTKHDKSHAPARPQRRRTPGRSAAIIAKELHDARRKHSPIAQDIIEGEADAEA